MNYDTAEQRVTIFTYWAQWEKNSIWADWESFGPQSDLFFVRKSIVFFLNFTCTLFKKKFKNEVD